MQDYYYPGKKRILPKKPVVQINIGMREPQPYGYHVPHMIPHGPKHLFVPGRGNMYNNRMRYNPVGEIIDFVADPIGFMVEKSLGLRSNKPKQEKKEGEAKKEEGKEKANEVPKEEPKEVVLRARKKETEEQEEPDYEEVEYKEDQDQIQQPEVICPACQNENICPECAQENICPECKGESICPECKGESICPECNNKFKLQTNKVNKVGKFNNFNFHEIVATSDNKKSYVVVKKGGVTISEK
jgi:hypothetical protein